MDEFEALPWAWIGDTGYGMYGSEEQAQAVNPVLSQTLGTLRTPTSAFDILQDKARRRHWWTRGRTQDRREGALQVEADKIGQIHSDYHTQIQQLGLEGVAPSLDEYSKQTMDSTVKDTVDQAAQHRAASIQNLQTKGSEYAGLAFDTTRSIFNDNRSTYDGKHGNITQSLDAAGDSVADAAMASGNPYAMMAGAAYKGMSMLNQVIGHSTDGMTKTDAILDSNLGFLATGGLNKLNAKFGTTTDKFEVDEDLHAAMGSSYIDTYGDLDDAESKADKRYGFLSKKSARKAQNEIHMADQRQNILSDINETAQDRVAAGNYEGIGFRNQMNLNGGFKVARAARRGIKMNLDFAHKIVRAQGGIKFNTFDMVVPDSVDPDAAKTPPLVPPILDIETSLNPQKPITEQDFKELGIVFRGFDAKGNLVYEVPYGLEKRLSENSKLIGSLIRRYGANGVVFNGVSSSIADTQNDTSQQGDQGTSQGQSGSNAPVQPNQGNNSQPPTPPVHLELPNPEMYGMHFNNLTEEDQLNFYKYFNLLLEGRKDELDNAFINNPQDDEMIHLVENVYEFMTNPENQLGAEATIGIGTGPAIKSIGIRIPSQWEQLFGQQNNTSNAESKPEDFKLRTDDQILQRKQGGTFTFMPYTDEQVNKFKAGGSFNVIPDGALHKNRHNMEGAEGLTKKGIPVVTEEDGKKVQQAEIEVNEIIFRLEVTEKLEKLAKEGTDEAALEAGKLLTEEILHNTHDNTGLIKETV